MLVALHNSGSLVWDLKGVLFWESRAESSGLSSLPTPRGGSGPASLDEGSDNGRLTETDSPFDLSLARSLPHQRPCLLFVQGGPAHRSPATGPMQPTSWASQACSHC